MKKLTSPNGPRATSDDANGSRSILTPVCALRMLSAALTALLLIGGAFTVTAVTFKVDSTRQWLGYMNVWETNGMTYLPSSSAWELPNLRAEFVKTNSNPNGWPLNDLGIQRINTNTFDNTDTNIPPYWNYPDGTGNKLLEANWYVDLGTNYGGQTVTFEGTVISNTIPMIDTNSTPTVSPPRWHVVAWVKEFTPPNYDFVDIVATTNLSPGAFSVSNDIGLGNVAQFGFFVYGPNTAPGSADSLKALVVKVEDSDPAVVTQPVAEPSYVVGDPISLTAEGVGATALSYRWQKDGIDVSNGGTVSGATTTNLLISPSAATNSGDYTFIVSDTAGSATSVVASVTVVNVLITNRPSDMRVEAGSTVVFKVGATSPNSLTYRWLYVTNGVTNIFGTPSPPFYNPPAYSSGATSDTLTLTNVQVSDTGTYLLRIYDGTSFLYVGADLLVKTPADYVNFLENPGFENDPTGLNESPWVRFVSTNYTFGEFQSTNDYYIGGDPVNVHGGNYVSFTSFNDVYSGIYQDVAAQPGQIFTADMWFYNAGGPGGDPIPGPPTTNEIYLEVQFRIGPGGEPDVLQQYTSTIFSYELPTNTWIDFFATNAGTFGGGTGEDGLYLKAPEGTTMVRFQLTMHDISGTSIGAGSIYYDDASLLLKIPADLTVTPSGGNVNLSWKTEGATSYQVQYKNDLNDSSWTDLEVVNGDGTVVTKSYPALGLRRFYRVQTQ